MKNIISLFISFFSILTFLNSPTTKKYSVGVLNENVQNLLLDSDNLQSNTNLKNYSTIYFSNLNKNLPLNSHGTCSFTAISMLLSFYDTYWNDSFIPETYDQTTFVDSEETNVSPDWELESPGVCTDFYSIVENMTVTEYQQYLSSSNSTNFQSFLINYARFKYGYGAIGNSQNPFALSFYYQHWLIYDYLVYQAGLTTNIFSMDILDETYSQLEKINFIREKILEGTPVLINVQSSTFGYHTMIAYDLDDTNIYVHTGWKIDDNKSLTHVSLNDLNIQSIDTLITLRMVNEFVGSNNIKDANGRPISVLNYACPNDISVPTYTFADIPPTFSWESLMNEKWFNDQDCEFSLSFESNGITYPDNFTVINSLDYTMSLNNWIDLISFCSFETITLRIKVFIQGFVELNDLESISKFSLPIDEGNIKQIAPTDYNFSDFYPTDDETRTSFVTHRTSNNYEFRTRRYRTGYIHDECVVMSPKRIGTDTAFIEYQFLKGVTRMDIEMAHWRDTAIEGLTSNTGILKVEVFKHSKYTEIKNLFDSDVNLPIDRNNKKTIKIYFDDVVFRVRIYSKMFNSSTNNNNRGRICIGNISIYETAQSYLPMNGYELDYDENYWNNSFVRLSHNCYTYAINLYPNIEGLGLQPFSYKNPGEYLSSNYNSYVAQTNNGFELTLSYFNPDVIENMVLDDYNSEIFNYQENAIIPISKNDICPDGYYKVALVFDLTDNNYDYHWYRQDSDGFWSHKLGVNSVSRLDSNFNIIVDPSLSTHEYSSHTYGNNSYGVTFFAIKPYGLREVF